MIKNFEKFIVMEDILGVDSNSVTEILATSIANEFVEVRCDMLEKADTNQFLLIFVACVSEFSIYSLYVWTLSIRNCTGIPMATRDCRQKS